MKIPIYDFNDKVFYLGVKSNSFIPITYNSYDKEVLLFDIRRRGLIYRQLSSYHFNAMGLFDVKDDAPEHPLYFFKKNCGIIPAGSIYPEELLKDEERAQGVLITNENLDKVNFVRYMLDKKYNGARISLDNHLWPLQKSTYNIGIYTYCSRILETMNIVNMALFTDKKHDILLLQGVGDLLCAKGNNRVFREYVISRNTPFTEICRKYMFPEL